MSLVSKYDIVKLLQSMIAVMAPTVGVLTSVDNGDGTFTLTVCDSSYLRTGSVFVVNKITYTVTAITVNESITIKGSVVLTGSFVLRTPLFITDSPQGINNFYLQGEQLNMNPFIWLLENFPTTYPRTRSSTKAQTRVRLFFLDVSDTSAWENQTHRDECISPMRNLIDTFIDNLESKISGRLTHTSTPFTITDRVNFGVYTTNKGPTDSIINAQLSGVELDITIPIQNFAASRCKCVPLDIQIFDTGTGFDFGFDSGFS